MPTDLFAAPDADGAPALPAEQVADLLRAAVPELALGLWTLEQVQPLCTLPHGSQRLTSCAVRWTDHCTSAVHTAELVVKEDRRVPRWADRVARLLVASGRGAGARHRVALPYGAGLPGVLVTERVAGHSVLAALLAAGDTAAAEAVGERLAEWLLDLQAAPVPLPGSTRRGLPEALPQLVEVAATVSRSHVAQGGLRRLAWQLHDSSLVVGEQAGVVSHGDLHPGNVFFAGPDTVAIDWDTAAWREPAYDAGYALAHLVIGSLRAGGVLQHALAAAAGFWAGYTTGGGAASAERVALQAARAFVQSLHFELVTYANGRDDVLEMWPLAARALLEHGPDGLEQLAPLGQVRTSAAS